MYNNNLLIVFTVIAGVVMTAVAANLSTDEGKWMKFILLPIFMRLNKGQESISLG
ncbi:MAG: hypothetical protein JO297_19820 [Nitrososphaeraceae archaeon]|nr:hypothetical protein [Nitrososphaeraceae archaeon]